MRLSAQIAGRVCAAAARLAKARAALAAAGRALGRAAAWALRAGAALALASILWAAAYGVLAPPTTHLIERERARLGAVERSWTPLAATPEHLRLALIAAEDARFCAHYGVDFAALREAWRAHQAGAPLRGASTISQQTAKNAFLWADRSYWRKALEAWFTGWIELFWSKRRVIEVYMNVAEFGEGVFGVEAAAQRYFNRSAAELTLRQSARLAAVLPAPRRRDPLSGGASFGRRVTRIVDGARTLAANGEADCVLNRAAPPS